VTGRKRRLPTLSQLDLDNFDDYATMQSGSRDAGAGSWARIVGGTKQNLPLLGGQLDPDGVAKCWCGKPVWHTDDHEWPERPQVKPLGHQCFYAASDPLFPTQKTCIICSHPDPANPEVVVSEALEERVHGKRRRAS
jgi:hypothetical protein